MKRYLLTVLIALCIAVPAHASWWKVVNMGVAAGGGAGTVSYSSTGSVVHVEANTTIATTAPANSSGDMLIAVVSDDADQALTDFDGFTLITSQTESSHRLSVGWLTADGTTAYSFVSGSSEKTAVIFRLTKDQGTWDIADFASAGALGDVTCPDMTVSQDNSMALILYGNDDSVGTIDGEPASMTQIVKYETLDPYLGAWYEAVDTGTVTGKEVQISAGSDATIIGVVVEAVE